jgi:hypothetical protein
MLAALTKKLTLSTGGLKKHMIGTALAGLQDVGDESAEARAMFAALALKVRQCADDLSDSVRIQEFVRTASMRGYATMSEEMRGLLKALLRE